MPFGNFTKSNALQLAEKNVKIARWSFYVFLGIALLIFLWAVFTSFDKKTELLIGFGAVALAVLTGILGLIQIEMAYYQMRKDSEINTSSSALPVAKGTVLAQGSQIGLTSNGVEDHLIVEIGEKITVSVLRKRL